MARGYLGRLVADLESPIESRGFGSGWFSGFFSILLALTGLCFVAALRWPDWFAMPELAVLRDWAGLRLLVHVFLLSSYALALLSLLLRPRKALGITALVIALAATILGGSNVQAQETQTWGIFFGVDFFIVNMLATGLMFAPLERVFPRNKDQRLFRTEWREDIFYFLLSSMLVQIFTYIALAPSTFVMAKTGNLADMRAWISSLPWTVQFMAAMFLTDLSQYWFHRLFHRIPFLWGFHAVHHSAKTMDWLAGARMHFIEIILLRGVTSLPLLTLGFLPSVLQAYIGMVYIYSSLIHANVRGDFNWLGKFLVIPRFHHWHHAIEAEGVDKNFAIHFPWLDKIFGTHYLPDSTWPKGYGVPESVPKSYWQQMKYPFVRKNG
jgi:sterol desaturase/sphingolipid hydroxylase (fatty acid hydroxylase superfamily)